MTRALMLLLFDGAPVSCAFRLPVDVLHVCAPLCLSCCVVTSGSRLQMSGMHSPMQIMSQLSKIAAGSNHASDKGTVRLPIPAETDKERIKALTGTTSSSY